LNSVLGVRVRPEALQRLKDHALENEQSVSMTLGQIIEEAMDSLEYDAAESSTVSP
jgi:ferritin